MSNYMFESHAKKITRGIGFLRTDDRGKVLLAVSIGWFLSIGVRLVYPVILPQLRVTYDLDLATAGLLITVLWWAYAIGQAPAGILGDRFGERIMLSASTIVSAIMLLLVVLAPWPSVLFGMTALFGFATALFGIARYTVISKLFSDRDGTAMGITLAAGSIGNIVLPVAAGAIAAVTAWQFGLGFTIPFFFLVGVYLWWVVPSDLAGNGSGTLSKTTVQSIATEFRKPTVVLVTALLLLEFGIWQAFSGMYPTYLVEIKGVQASTAAILFGFYFAIGAVIQPIAGTAYDRIGIKRAMPAFLLPTVIGLIALPFTEGFVQIVIVTVFTGCMMANIAIAMPYLTSVLHEDVQGAGLGIIRTGYMMFGATSPLLFGVFADLGYFDHGFWVLAGMGIVMILIVSRLPDVP